MSLRLVGAGVLTLLITFGVGWMLGASGRSDAEQAAASHLLRAQTAEAEALLLDARLSLLETNFGAARRALADAGRLVTATQAQLRETGQAEPAGRLELVHSHIRDADQLAIALDPAAHAAVQTAVGTLRTAVSGDATR